MSFEFVPAYYQVSAEQFTNKSTLAPVAAGEPFYQEEQQPNHCTVHSMNIFAGRLAVVIHKLVSLNNEYHIEKYKEQETFLKESQGLDLVPFLEISGLYVKSMEDIAKNGLGNSEILKLYIESNKSLFTLPPTCQILMARDAISTHIEIIESRPKLHRVIVAMFNHNVAFRKDETGLWRAIDSMTLCHDKQATDKLAQLQPSFNSLRKAIETTLPSVAAYYGASPENGVRAVFYPSEDYSPLTLVIAERSGLPPSVSMMIDAYVE